MQPLLSWRKRLFLLFLQLDLINLASHSAFTMQDSALFWISHRGLPRDQRKQLMQGKGPWTGSWGSQVTSWLCSNTGPFARPVFPTVKRSRLSGKLNKLFIALRMKIWETIVPYRTVVLKGQSLDQTQPHYLEIIRNALISGPILNLLNQKQGRRGSSSVS